MATQLGPAGSLNNIGSNFGVPGTGGPIANIPGNPFANVPGIGTTSLPPGSTGTAQAPSPAGGNFNTPATPAASSTTSPQPTSAQSSSSGGVGSSAVQPQNVTPAPLPAAPTTPNVNFGGYNPTQSGGLISTAQIPLANTTQSQSTNWNVSPSQLTSNQLNGILQSSSPLMAGASLQADQSMAARGLLNSSMTGGAEEAAMINAATPIAQANAQTLAASAAQNAQESTQANLATAAQSNAAAQQQAGAVNSALQTNASANNAASQFNSQGNLTAAETNASNQMQSLLAQYNAGASAEQQAKAIQGNIAVANMNGQYSALINSNSSFSTAFSNLQAQISQIASNPNVPNPGTMIQQLVSDFTNYADTMQNVTGLNLSSNFQ